VLTRAVLLPALRPFPQTKFPAHEGKDKAAVEDPAICLLCGRILNAGAYSLSADNLFFFAFF
jgi:hypothetical protein